MLVLLIGALFASAGTAYAIGYAFIAPRDSFFRTKFGGLLLVGLALTFLFLPPQLMSMGSSLAGIGAKAGSGVMSAFAWPTGLNREVYRFSWILLMIAGLLSGIRVWKIRDPEWRRGSSALDSTGAGRAEGLLPLANSLEDALEVLQRVKITQKDVARLKPQLQAIGRRFGHQLPAQNSAAYNLIVRYVSPSVAAAVTGHILEGAVRLEPTKREGS